MQLKMFFGIVTSNPDAMTLRIVYDCSTERGTRTYVTRRSLMFNATDWRHAKSLISTTWDRRVTGRGYFLNTVAAATMSQFLTTFVFVERCVRTTAHHSALNGMAERSHW